MELVAFDFDGTLSDSEMMVLLGERYGVADRIADITGRAMNDELDYAESIRQRATLLAEMPADAVDAAFDQVFLRNGAAPLIRALNEAGVYTAILTGGFERGVERALEKEGVSVDTIVSNRLPLESDVLTGGVEGSLIEGTKDDALDTLAMTEGIDVEDAIAVGDGANDLPMLKRAGWGIGFEPKPAVRPHCDVTVESMAELQELFEDDGVL